jgi:phosphatidylinositol alpha-1,6-mannosyltransferase
VQELAADVVVFGAAFPLGLMGAAIRSRTGVPYVAFTHGLEVSAARMPFGGLVLGQIGRKASAVTYVSHWCERELSSGFGTHPRHVLLPPAIDDSWFHPGVSGEGVRARHALGDAPVVVCVSRLVERKGQDTLIEALSTIRHGVPGARLLIVGDGPHRKALAEQVKAAGQVDNVVFAGQVSVEDLPSYYAAGDVFAMPCRERRFGLEVEAFGIVFIQAQAVGVPVVAGNIGGVPDTLVDGETGFLVDSSSTPDVAAGVIRALSAADRVEMGAAAAERVSAGFTWRARTEQLRGMLAQVSDSPSV